MFGSAGFQKHSTCACTPEIEKEKTMEKHGIMDASERTPKISNSITSEDTIA
jgi:hypothetical protein